MNMLKNGILSRGCNTFAALVAIIVLVCTGCATPAAPKPATGEAVAAEEAEEPRNMQGYTDEERQEVDAAKDVVKKYWIATNSSYVGMYALFSSNYKQILNQYDGIADEEDFRESIPRTERYWPKQTYQRARFNLQLEPPQMQIVVLSEWKEEGYSGVMTFIFELVKEGGEWKIAKIMF
jgi:hypothetical protein